MRKLKLTTALFLGVAVLGVAATVARQALARRPDEEGKKAVPAQNVRPATKAEEAPRLPDKPMPVLVLAKLEKDGKVAVHVTHTVYVQRPVVDKGGSQRVVVEQANQVSLRVIDAKDVRGFDTRGKEVPPKALERFLKKSILAFAYTHGQEPDPQHLRLIREGTLILVLPAQPLRPAPPPVPGGPVAPPLPADAAPGGFFPPPAPSTPLPAGTSTPPPYPGALTPPEAPATPAPGTPSTPRGR